MKRTDHPTVGEMLDANGVSRRTFIQYCTMLASLLALPAGSGRVLAENLRRARKPSVIYLPFQECTGCLESLTRSFAPSVESLLFDTISLDYQETLFAAAGSAAEAAREAAMRDNDGEYVLLVDGAVPVEAGGAYCMIGGQSAVHLLEEAAAGAAAIVAIGTCASFGGVPHAQPNPTGAVPVAEIVKDKPVVNISGCPPIPAVITGTLVHFLALGSLPDLDSYGRPLAFYGDSIHDRCYRRPFFDAGKFAKSFDDEGARQGWCLYELGCKGPITYNACATVKWNGGVSFPIQSGHGCLGCSEPDFWDKGGFYNPLSGRMFTTAEKIAAGTAGGVLLGAGAAALSRWRKQRLLHATAKEESA